MGTFLSLFRQTSARVGAEYVDIPDHYAESTALDADRVKRGLQPPTNYIRVPVSSVQAPSVPELWDNLEEEAAKVVLDAALSRQDVVFDPQSDGKFTDKLVTRMMNYFIHPPYSTKAGRMTHLILPELVPFTPPADLHVINAPPINTTYQPPDGRKHLVIGLDLRDNPLFFHIAGEISKAHNTNLYRLPCALSCAAPNSVLLGAY